MPIEILMPALSPTMTEGKLAKWLKSEGDTVEAGDVLAEIETDKATMEVEAVDEGTLGKIVVSEGSEGVAVNSVIALLLEEGEDKSALNDVDTSKPKTPEKPKDSGNETDKAAPKSGKGEENKAKSSGSSPQTKNGDRIFASPLARRMASQEELDLSKLEGSGPRGRIVKRDIEKALTEGVGKAEAPQQQKSAATVTAPAISPDDPIFSMMPEFEAVPNSGMRKTIAKRLTEAARDIPHFNLQVDVEIDKLLAFRKDLNGREGADYKISVNDFIVKATALALKHVPDCNVAFTDEAILKFKQVDMAVAVAVEGGLITPILKDAGSKGLATLSNEMKELAGKARDGKLKPEEYQGGTFTVSNLGMFGVKSFNSIINPPQGGILSVGAGEQRPVVKDGSLAIATVVTLTLAVDHRCIDGSVGAALIKELKSLIEDPITLML